MVAGRSVSIAGGRRDSVFGWRVVCGSRNTKIADPVRLCLLFLLFPPTRMCEERGTAHRWAARTPCAGWPLRENVGRVGTVDTVLLFPPFLGVEVGTEIGTGIGTEPGTAPLCLLFPLFLSVFDVIRMFTGSEIDPLELPVAVPPPPARPLHHGHNAADLHLGCAGLPVGGDVQAGLAE